MGLSITSAAGCIHLDAKRIVFDVSRGILHVFVIWWGDAGRRGCGCWREGWWDGRGCAIVRDRSRIIQCPFPLYLHKDNLARGSLWQMLLLNKF